MFIITNEQMKALEEHGTKKFILKAADHLKKTFPQKLRNIPDTELKLTIEKGIMKASSYGINEQYDVLRYLELVISLGESFDESPPVPAVKTYLKTTNYSGTQKMDKIQSLEILKL